MFNEGEIVENTIFRVEESIMRPRRIGFLIGLYIAYLMVSGELTTGRPFITFVLLLILGEIQILSFGLFPFKSLPFGKKTFVSKKKISSLEN